MIGGRVGGHLRHGDGIYTPSCAHLDTGWPLGSPAIAPDLARREAGLENGEVLAPAVTA